MTTAYADASAIVKLILAEEGTTAMEHLVNEFDEVITSRVGVIEVRRAAARRAGTSSMADEVLSRLGVVELDKAIAATAGVVEPASIRTLDAIHLATALALYHVDVVVTYDVRLAEAARAAGLTVASPA